MPSEQAERLARAYLGKPSPVESERPFYEQNVSKLAAMADAAFAKQPRFQFSEEQVREWCQEFRDSGLKMDSAGLPGFLVEKLNGFRAP